MDTLKLLEAAVAHGASDIFIIAGRPVTYKASGRFLCPVEDALDFRQAGEVVAGIYALAPGRTPRAEEEGDDDFSFAVPGLSRFRVNVYKQRGSLAAVVRVISFQLPRPEELGLPPQVLALAEGTRGIVLVTGPAGSGKSTTLACLVDRINRTREGHIITLEDPLEFLHRHQKSIVSQREIATDTKSYVDALRASLRQSPDVILLGEMRDHETINVAMTAAETGHLIFSTLHTQGAANTVDRVIDAFPPVQQNQIRIQLAMVLQAVVSQQLVPTTDGGIAPAFEILVANPAVRNLIRESKLHQLETVMQAGSAEGMLTMDASLLELVRQGRITPKAAVTYSPNPDAMAKRLHH